MKLHDLKFRHEAEKIRVEPPRSAWKRIEAQLDADTSKRKLKIARLMSYAAAIVLFAVFATVSWHLSTNADWQDSELYSLSLQELATDAPIESSIYDVEKVKDLTAYWRE